MCFNSGTSLATFIFGITCAFYLLHRGIKYNHTRSFLAGILLFVVAPMQLLEYFLWENQDNKNINSIVSIMIFSSLFQIGWSHGIVQSLYENDVTKISVVMVIIFVWQSLACGVEILNQCSPFKSDKGTKKTVDRGWFLSDILLSMGMVGTVIGFIAMLTGFFDLDFTDAESVQALIGNLGYGMSTALTTTLVGLVCSILLKLQFFMLENVIDENKQ